MRYKIQIGKKGMDAAQVFIFVISLVVLTMILIYGFKVIVNMVGTNSKVEYLNFKTNIQDYIKSYSSDYGSIGYKKLIAPSGVKTICFTDYDWPRENPTADKFNLRDCNLVYPNNKIINPNPIVGSSFEDPRAKLNLFLFDTRNNFLKNYYIGNVSLSTEIGGECNYLCINTSRNSFYIKLVGMGDHVKISKYKSN